MIYRNLLKYCFTILLFFSVIGLKATEGLSYVMPANEIVVLLDAEENVVIVDIRKPEKYNEGHYAGAVNIWRSDYEDTTYQFGGMMPTKDQLQQLLSSLGVVKDSKLLLYDGKGGCDAARFWWILKTHGHHDAYIIDGGFEALIDEKSKITNVPTLTITSKYEFPQEELFDLYASMEDVKEAIDDANTILLDTRTLDEYLGETLKKGAFRSGRIPNSIHSDWTNCIHYDNGKLLKSKKDLIYDFNELGVTKDKKVIVYCQSGVRSAHTTFVLTQVLGYKNVSNYDGSWIEWSYNKELPVDSGGMIFAKGLDFVPETSYWYLFLDSFYGYANYVWSEITFQTNPWYQNYFWWLIVLSVFVWLLELIFPWRKNQPHIRADFWIDAFYMFFNFFIFNLVIFIAFCNLTSRVFADFFGGDLSNLALINIQDYPEWLQLLIFFIATDFIQWFTHVMLHRFDFLWRFHKVHHSVEEMGFAAHLRYHWMENVFYTPMKYIMVMLIGGFHPEQAFVVYYVAIAIGHLNHANVGLEYGPLKYIFNNAKMHIWHHYHEMPESHPKGVNFGISLSIWDYMFRTNYIPHSGRDIKLGFDKIEEFPKSFFKQLMTGFNKK